MRQLGQTSSLGTNRGRGQNSRNVAEDSVEHERLGAVLFDRVRTERDLGELSTERQNPDGRSFSLPTNTRQTGSERPQKLTLDASKLVTSTLALGNRLL